MRRIPLLPLVGALIVMQTIASRPTHAASIRALTFTEVVQRASVILRGRVVGTRSYRNVQGGATALATQRASRSPETAANAAASAAVGVPQVPVALPAEGTGRMIFTQIDVEVGWYLKGGGGSIVTLTMPGGTVDGVTAWIPDLPTFSQGENVLLFLRDGYDRVGDPAVGVNQGVFRIVSDPAGGGEIVLNSQQQIVIGVENDVVVTRRNPRATTASSQLVPGNAGPPTPNAPGIVATASAAASRFLTSTEPAVTVSAFLSAVTARLPR